jgi:signal transduction histidine kinase
MNPPKVLFVDDELELERLLRQRLRKQIHNQELELIFAANGRLALEAIQSQGPVDLVVTDINMPEMDGLTLLDKLPQLDQTLKAVVVSAYSDMQNIRTAMHRGAFDFVTKPIDFNDLVLTIDRTIRHVHSIREAESRLQQAQIQVIQNEKMATLGQLVAGVAHEINNPVSFIAGNIDLAAQGLQDIVDFLKICRDRYQDQDLEEKAEEIDLDYLLEDLPKMLSSMKLGTDRIRNISNSLRTFSRSDSQAKIDANIHDGIDSTLMILQHRLKANNNRPAIEIIKNYGDLPLIPCYLGQLNQVFMNLLSNAIDALEEGNNGLNYNEIVNRPNQIHITTTISDNQALIKIKDNGKGIPEEIKNRIFEHLFTTKGVGKGTGLGLSISRQIIEEVHCGKIMCESVVGQGTEFVIAIPLSS